ncbi:hypothetical protein CCHR01_19604 [Colletotrichum chrysophilum]|uniref:Uncharacterized protein n=1 Tax=Colletotrichum chrysophilum TaxID=1836956 RepID=A0AAD8ZY01_9PEZI|nr:hypothetical protein CCHR01_19604 [Colletotrichum chrysophilum]
MRGARVCIVQCGDACFFGSLHQGIMGAGVGAGAEAGGALRTWEARHPPFTPVVLCNGLSLNLGTKPHRDCRPPNLITVMKRRSRQSMKFHHDNRQAPCQVALNTCRCPSSASHAAIKTPERESQDTSAGLRFVAWHMRHSLIFPASPSAPHLHACTPADPAPLDHPGPSSSLTGSPPHLFLYLIKSTTNGACRLEQQTPDHQPRGRPLCCLSSSSLHDTIISTTSDAAQDRFAASSLAPCPCRQQSSLEFLQTGGKSQYSCFTDWTGG